MSSHTCGDCSYHYIDGFCTFNLSYTSNDHTCTSWTDEVLRLDYDFLYRRCKDYIRICDMYTDHEKMREENPDKVLFDKDYSLDFFLQCCLNDLKRELSLYKITK